MKSNYKSFIIVLTAITLLSNCNKPNLPEAHIADFKEYYEAAKVKSDLKWNYLDDTVRVWFEQSDTIPSLRYKGQPISKWGEWDIVMHSNSFFDTLWYTPEQHAIQGVFYESNDFYDLIGADPNKTRRTYTLNLNNKITDILYERIETENTISDRHLDPIYNWAIQNDSLEIMEIYPNKQFVPSTENAKRWKKLLYKYGESTK